MFNVTSTYHGNPQPSFTGVITHILKAKNLDFSFLGGFKGTNTCCLVLRLDPISPCQHHVVSVLNFNRGHGPI